MFATVHPLQKEGTQQQITDNKEISEALLESFFPPPPEHEEPEQDVEAAFTQLPFEPITEEEVKAAVFRAKPMKAPGMDGLPVLVWHEVWPILANHITLLFKKSVTQAKVPEAWKTAKIIPLKKADRDYRMASSYRPISLLPILGKALESLMAERISYLTEEKHLLPNTHFGARKLRSTTQALTYLQESIFDSWRCCRVVSFVTFDVKGAYNNIATKPLLQRMRERQIPEAIVEWTENFCSERKACMFANGYTSKVAALPPAGIPQGSTLAPILFLFFNANLVPGGKSMAFVDDYSAWVAGPTVDDNTRILQECLISKLLAWEKSRGAVFEASKTGFIHFTRKITGDRDRKTTLTM